jgi:hypothetical protein
MVRSKFYFACLIIMVINYRVAIKSFVSILMDLIELSFERR